MNVNTKKIFEAQMAVSDRVKYPEFAGNVKSVDTRSFVRPSKGQPSCYYENAETFLEIGEALGQAMTELLKNKAK
jgi:alpha-galactosidase